MVFGSGLLIRDCGQLWIVAPGNEYGITSDGQDHAGGVEMRQIAATVPFLVRSVMTWERGHPARIYLHLHPVRIFHPAQFLQCVRLTRKRARCPRSQGFHFGQDARAPRVLYASRVDHLSGVDQGLRTTLDRRSRK